MENQILEYNYSYRPFFSNAVFYPCGNFDVFYLRKLNSDPETYKVANFLNVDNFCFNNFSDIENNTNLFKEFKIKLDSIWYYKFDNEPILQHKIDQSKFLLSFYDQRVNEIRMEMEDISLLNKQTENEWEIFSDEHLREKIEALLSGKSFFALFRGSKKAVYKGIKGHPVVYIMFVFSEAYDFYENTFKNQNITPLVFAEKMSDGNFCTKIDYENLLSKWIFTDRLSENDRIKGYTKLNTIYAGFTTAIQVFKLNTD